MAAGDVAEGTCPTPCNGALAVCKESLTKQRQIPRLQTDLLAPVGYYGCQVEGKQPTKNSEKNPSQVQGEEWSARPSDQLSLISTVTCPLLPAQAAATCTQHHKTANII
ncbi:hypothetical protein Bbelb_225030 [Branchiostoma belcheri]|nr:hypothetical protein Bbelb_225030 [Branchiostoma belcheri]